MTKKININFEDVKKMYIQEGLTYKEISLKYGCGANTVRKIAKRHGFKSIRGKSKHRKIIIQKSNVSLFPPSNLLDLGINRNGIEVILGGLLGDGSIRRREYKKKVSYNVYFANNEKQLDYIKFKFSFFNKNEVNPIRIDIPKGITRIKGKDFYRQNLYCFSTKVYDFSKIYNELIKDDVKSISLKYLKWLTPLSLAIWYQDDGSYNKNNRVIRIATMCFTQIENNIIKDYFYDILKMPCFLEKVNCGKGYSLVLTQNSTNKFLKLVEPYLCKCMNYKNPSETSKTENCFVSREVRLEPNIAKHPNSFGMMV